MAYVKVSGELKSNTIDPKVVDASAVMDSNMEDKPQSEINAELANYEEWIFQTTGGEKKLKVRVKAEE